MDGFAESLRSTGHRPDTIRQAVQAAVHLGRWLDAAGDHVQRLDEAGLDAFKSHLQRCRCRGRAQRRRKFARAMPAAPRANAQLTGCPPLSLIPVAEIPS